MGISSALGSSALLPAGLGFRNLIINGEVVVDQRAATATVNTGASYAYGPDRWLGLGTASAGVFTIARSTTVAPDGFRNSLVAQCTTLDSSMASGDNYQILTHLEGFNVADLGYGTSWAKQTWLTFWVRSSKTGTYSVSLRNSAINRSFVAEYTINGADTWEFKRIQIVGDTTGTWVVDNGLGLRVAWSLGCGSGGTTSTLNAWQGANVVASTNQTNWMDSQTSRFFYLTGVQLEQNYQPTPFEQRPYGVELQLCQRYYQAYGFNSQLAITNAVQHDTNDVYAAFTLPVTMRTAPTYAGTNATNAFIKYGNATGTAFNALTINAGQTTDRIVEIYVLVAGTKGDACWIRTNASTTHYSLSAEL